MALSFDFSELADPTICRKTDGTVSGSTECVIWATIFVGLPRITDANWRDFATRVRAYETCFGALSSSDEPLPPELIHQHIGLRTNASPMTKRAFQANLGRIALERAAAALRADLTKEAGQ